MVSDGMFWLEAGKDGAAIGFWEIRVQVSQTRAERFTKCASIGGR